MPRISEKSKKEPVVRQTQAERRSESDRRLISAAVRLIAKRGASGTSLADIGIAAGYSRGLPAERFGSKLNLLLALIDEFDGWFQARTARTVGGKRGLKAIEARIAAHVNGFSEYPDGGATLYHLMLESIGLLPELHERVSELDESYRRGFAVHIREGQADGEIAATVDPERFARIILGMIRGIHIQALLQRDTSDLDWAKNEISRFCRVALKA